MKAPLQALPWPGGFQYPRGARCDRGDAAEDWFQPVMGAPLFRSLLC